MALGYKHALFLDTEGRVYGGGQNKNMELGLGSQQEAFTQFINYPIQIQSLNHFNISQVIAGGFSSALTVQDELLIWGTGEFGQFKSPQKLYMDQVSFRKCKIGKF